MEDKTFTQEDVDRIVQERLARERSKYDELSIRYNELNKEHVNLIDKNKEYEQKLAELPKYQRQAIVNEVARELKVPDVLVSRLSGESKEEIAEDAKKLMADLGQLDKDQYRGLPATPNGSGQPPKKGMGLLIENIKEV